MTPKEKANELVSKFVSISLSQYVDLVDGIRIRLAKQCALIAVDELINSLPPFEYGLEFVAKIQFWLDVKYEIIEL